MFKAIGHDDRANLRTLAKNFIEKGKDIPAFLCLDRVFLSPPDL